MSTRAHQPVTRHQCAEFALSNEQFASPLPVELTDPGDCSCLSADFSTCMARRLRLTTYTSVVNERKAPSDRSIRFFKPATKLRG